jgi:hypothetical protein
MAPQFVGNSESIAAFIPDLERLIAEAMDEWKIPGLAVGVMQNGEMALVRAYGFRDVEAGLPVTTDTHFTICSITKSFTATGLALLTEERRLDWTNRGHRRDRRGRGGAPPRRALLAVAPMRGWQARRGWRTSISAPLA